MIPLPVLPTLPHRFAHRRKAIKTGLSGPPAAISMLLQVGERPTPLRLVGPDGCHSGAKPECLLFSCRKTARVMSRTRIRRAGIDQNGGRKRQMGQSRNVFCYQATRCRGLRHAPGFGGARTGPSAGIARGPYMGLRRPQERGHAFPHCVVGPDGYGPLTTSSTSKRSFAK